MNTIFAAVLIFAVIAVASAQFLYGGYRGAYGVPAYGGYGYGGAYAPAVYGRGYYGGYGAYGARGLVYG